MKFLDYKDKENYKDIAHRFLVFIKDNFFSNKYHDVLSIYSDILDVDIEKVKLSELNHMIRYNREYPFRKGGYKPKFSNEMIRLYIPLFQLWYSRDDNNVVNIRDFNMRKLYDDGKIRPRKNFYVTGKSSDLYTRNSMHKIEKCFDALSERIDVYLLDYLVQSHHKPQKFLVHISPFCYKFTDYFIDTMCRFERFMYYNRV